MKSMIIEASSAGTPESLVEKLSEFSGTALVRAGSWNSFNSRYSIVVTDPFLTFRSYGARCEIKRGAGFSGSNHHFGSPWPILERLMSLYELQDQIDLPFPSGGCFGYWGYDLKNFLEPGLPRRALNDLEFPDCHLGFYDSLVVFDHGLGKKWVVSTGLDADGTRSESRAKERVAFWLERLEEGAGGTNSREVPRAREFSEFPGDYPAGPSAIFSTMTRGEFLHAVEQAQAYIRAGDIYQVNISQRLRIISPNRPWEIFCKLSAIAPAPNSAYVDCGEFQIASSSPELFLHLSGSHIETRPIKGTRPRDADPLRDAQLTYELQTSAKEIAELVMITDLLRNDLGRVCEFGSVQVPEMLRLEKFSYVQHLVSTVEGRLSKGISHLSALAACFPGGSISGAPKYKAMEIIDQLEPTARGPYTGALGYLGFNRESHVAMIIRSALCRAGQCWFQVGAGIVADSVPAAEYDETVSKAMGFLAAIGVETTAGLQPILFKREPGSAVWNAEKKRRPQSSRAR